MTEVDSAYGQPKEEGHLGASQGAKLSQTAGVMWSVARVVTGSTEMVLRQ